MSPLLSSLLTLTPLILVWTLGIALAILRLPSSPQAAYLSLAGLGLLVVTSLLEALVWQVWVPTLSASSAALLGLSRALWGLLDAVGIGLLLAAIAVGRTP